MSLIALGLVFTIGCNFNTSGIKNNVPIVKADYNIAKL
jgi:hypothetical protein